MQSEILAPAHFDKFMQSLERRGITQFDYFVNWSKVLNNVEAAETELCLLNSLIGKQDFETALIKLLTEYPKVIKAIPSLLAIREKSVDVLIDTSQFLYQKYTFTHESPSKETIAGMAQFVLRSGLGELLQNRQIKNLVDYCLGVEVGLDSNGRKNRGGTQMEKLVESFLGLICHENGSAYLAQANAAKIKKAWGIDIQVDKSKRIIDFVVKRPSDNNLFFIECNFYGSGGSKLKSTATEYIEMSRFWQTQNITFIWITDGKGWVSTRYPLEEYFDKGNILLNIAMLQEGYLQEILDNA